MPSPITWKKTALNPCWANFWMLARTADSEVPMFQRETQMPRVSVARFFTVMGLLTVSVLPSTA